MPGRRSTRRGSSASRPELRPVVTELDAPLTIGLISDTHIFERGDRWVPDPVVALFHRYRVGLIAHLGDVTSHRTLDQLGEIAPVLAVRGNNDLDDMADLPMRRELRVGTHRILMVHGHGGASAYAVASSAVAGYDCVLFGHSHKPLIERIGGTLLVNPGSPTDRRFNPHFGVGILHVGVERIEAEVIVFLRTDELNGIEPQP
jgi:putative phosphoesterase